ncbi:MAG: ATP-binding protein [Actinomycetota bacterium]|nr:ATP-binding protein [Actinomycetota bacterium]
MHILTPHPLSPFAVVVLAAVTVTAALLGAAVGSARSRYRTRRRLTSVVSRLGAVSDDAPVEGRGEAVESDIRLEGLLSKLERMTGNAVEAVNVAKAEASRLRHAIDVLPHGIVIRDEHGDVIFRNASAGSLIGSRHSDLLAARTIDEQLESTGPVEPSERTIELYGPPRRTLVIRASPLDDGNQSLGVVAVMEDVSERRRLEAVRKDFVANVSHELKTPVAALALLAETLADEKDPMVTQRLAGRIQTEAVRVGRIIEDLLDLSRIEAEEAPPREPVSAGLIVAEAADRVRSAAERRQIRIEVAEPADDCLVLGDRRQFVSAVHNLIDNAVKYSPDGSAVHVETGTESGWVDIVVKDHGIGIPARDLSRIFERFYRVDQARSRSSGGTGLGLAIVRHVAGNHGGRVMVNSREGEGSVFTLRLPTAGQGR